MFERLPAGSGDLIVRGRIRTELQAQPAADGQDGMAFVDAGLGGVNVGQVIGVDARGSRCPGTMRFCDGELEFVLPAAFVDRAVLPLTVDPLAGTAVNMSNLPLLDDRFVSASNVLTAEVGP